jgi:FkbM family methyltransferase
MHEEINAPFWRNPSSYSHPKVTRGRVEWVVDGGSCEGYFADYVRKVHQAATILCVEARADVAHALRATFAPQLENAAIKVLEVALGASAGSARLVANANLPWETRVADASVDLPASEENLEALSGVSVATLDALLLEQGVRGTGWIKLDVEGAEEAVLRGAVDTMRLLKPRLSVAVYHGRDNAERCKAVVLEANPAYQIRFRGMYGWASPLRPYMLYAW